MRFAFDEQKAAEAAALLLEFGGGSMPYIKLIKLLYLADRQSLIETGFPITGDKMVSMEHGPVLSRVYDYNKVAPSREASPPAWYSHVSPPSDYEVHLMRPAGRETLSDYEVSTIEHVFSSYGHMGWWALRNYTHSLPEWEDPHGSSFPIDIRRILEDAGKSDQEIEHISAHAQEHFAFAKLVSRAT